MVIGVVRDPSGLWDLILPRLSRCLPLTNLICSDPTGTFKSVPRLQISFELEPAHPPDAFFCILLFHCHDLDSYKRHKSLIDGFVHDPFVQARSWLVAVVSLGTSGPIRPTRRLIERIEADLSDRINDDQGQVVLIDLADAVTQDYTQTERLTNALKRCVEVTAERRSAEFEGRLRSMQQLGVPTDFTAYFSVKESYSLFYQDLGLIDDALRQYDELDALLDTLPLSSSSGTGTTTTDWSLMLLSDALVPLPASCSPYHYFAYVFSRQIRLLFVLDRIETVIERAARFIRNLKNFHHDVTEKTFQIVSIVLAIGQMTNDGSIVELLSLALSSFEQSGLILHLIEFQLESVAFLTPSVLSTDDDQQQSIDFLKITPSELQSCFQSQQLYQKYYIAFAELVRRSFQYAGRRRLSASLCYRLGSVYFRLGHIKTALDVFESGSKIAVNSWSYCSLSDLIMKAQCLYLLKDIHSYIDTALVIFRNQCQQDDVRIQFRNQFLERMKAAAAGVFRRPGSELIYVLNLGLERNNDELHAACNTDLFCNESFMYQIDVKSISKLSLPLSSLVLVLRSATTTEQIELSQLTLHPGRNTFVFDNAKLSRVGHYSPVSIVCRIEELILELALDQVGPALIRVGNRSSTAVLEIGPVPDPLILGRTHALPVRCLSNFDQMTEIQLSLQSISNPNLIQAEMISVVIDGSSTNVLLQNGHFPIGDCRAHDQIELVFNVNPPMDAVLHQELSLILTYLVDGIRVSTQAHTSLIFTMPLSLSSSMETVLNRTFIQLVLHCTTQVPVQLHSYTFQPGPFSFQELNPALNQNLISSSSSGYSFIFQILDRADHDRDIDDPDFLENFVFRGHFGVRCQPTGGLLTDFEFPVNIRSSKRDPSFMICISCTSRAFLGQSILFSIRVNRPPQSTMSTPRVLTQQLAYDIVFDEKSWRYAGTLHGRVSLQNEAVISAVIIPITNGYLTVPTIKLSEIVNGNAVEIDQDQISNQFDTRQVLVLSRGRFVAGLKPHQ